MSILAANSTLITSMLTSVSVCVLVPLIMTGIMAWNKKVSDKQNKQLNPTAFKVRYNSLAIGMLIFAIVFLTLATILFPILYICDIPDGPPIEAAIGATVGFGVITVLMGIMLYAFRRWEVDVSEECLKLVPHFAKCREYRWEDISYVKCTVARGIPYYQVYIKEGKKSAFNFTSVLVGGKRLAEIFQSKGLIIGTYL